MEGSFAQAANQHHCKKARWRRLWRQQIQDWLIAAVQNIAILCGKTGALVGARLKTPPKIGKAAAALAIFARIHRTKTQPSHWYASILSLPAQTAAA
jgi:hypothetical protein